LCKISHLLDLNYFMEFKRQVQPALIEWKNNARRKPLVLQGARQVGKTHLLKNLGRTAFTDTAYFNFETQPNLKEFFENTKEVKRIIRNLSLIHGKEINPKNTLIIFDEIQECNHALNSLKYFCEETPEYAVASAGFLLGITLGKNKSFPVGKVDFLHVLPLSFTEFLAQANSSLADYLKGIDTTEKIPAIFFNQLLDYFNSYFISGGMPEAAATLLENQDMVSTQKVLDNILMAYRLDFSKHTPSKDIARINYVWNSIPTHLSRENKKFLYQALKPGARAREYEDALHWLVQAGLVSKVYRCNKPNLPLSAYDDLSAFKLYLVDIGLLRVLSGLDASIFSEKNKIFSEFKGALTENYILQSLLTQFSGVPRYWTSGGQAEVDFLFQYKNRIIPCEVKSSENTKSRSLTVYAQKYKPATRIRYSLLNLSMEGDLLNIPLFLADQTKNILDKL